MIISFGLGDFNMPCDLGVVQLVHLSDVGHVEGFADAGFGGREQKLKRADDCSLEHGQLLPVLPAQVDNGYNLDECKDGSGVETDVE